MGTDALGFTIALLTIGMSMVAVRNRNILLTLGAAVLWTTLMAFILANTTAGSNWQTMFVVSAATFMIAYALLSFITKQTGEKTVDTGGSEAVNKSVSSYEKGGLTSLSEAEYKAFIRRKTHPRIRGR